MARMRTLHPEFFSDNIALNLDHTGRLFYQGTWCFSDDFGRGRALMRELAGYIFPHEEEVVVKPHFTKLVELGKLHVYEAGGQEYFHQVNWYKYQRPNRPTASKLPRPTVENCPGCAALCQAGTPWIDKLEVYFEAKGLGLDLSDKELWAALVDDHAAQLQSGITVPSVRLVGRPRPPLMELIHEADHGGAEGCHVPGRIHALHNSVSDGNGSVTDGKKPGSVTDAKRSVTDGKPPPSVTEAGSVPRRNQELGIRNQEVGIRSSNVPHVRAHESVAAAVFHSIDEVPDHVPLSVAHEMVTARVDATGMPDGWLDGLDRLVYRFLGYYAKGGAQLPPSKASEIKQFLVNFQISATRAIELFDAYDAETKRRKAAKPRVQSINFFQQAFERLIAADAALGSPEEQAAKKSRFAAYTQRTPHAPSDRQHV